MCRSRSWSRIEALGGTAELDTGPGEGTEWELTVSKETGHAGPGRIRVWQTRTRGGSDGRCGDAAVLRVMVVDDHPMWRDGVARDLADAGFEVVAVADSVAAATARGRAVRPDVVLMDMQLPDGNGAQATVGILEVSPRTRVLVLSASDERDDVLEAVKAGASGYLVKSASKEELLAAVRSTAAGQAVFTPGLAGLVLGEYRRIARDPDRAGRRAGAHRPGDRGAAVRRKGIECQADRVEAHPESPHGGKPRAGDPAEAAAG